MIENIWRQILRHLHFCLVFETMVLVSTLSPTQSLRYHLQPNTEICIKEEVKKNVLVAGEYRLTFAPGQRTDLAVIDSKGQTYFFRENLDKGTFAVTSPEDDIFDICFVSYLQNGQQTGPQTELLLRFKHGLEAKNNEEEESFDTLDNTTVASEEMKNDKLPEDSNALTNGSKEVSDSSDSETQTVNSSHENNDENIGKTDKHFEENIKNISETNVSNETFGHSINISNEDISESETIANKSTENLSNDIPLTGEVTKEEKLEKQNNEINLNFEPNVNSSEINDDLIGSKNNDTSDESSDKKKPFVDNLVVNQTDAKTVSDSENVNIDKRSASENNFDNKLSDNSPQNEPNFDIKSNSVDFENQIRIEEPNVVLTQESNPILNQKPNVIPTEEPNSFLTQESNPILNEEPNSILNEEPNRILNEESNPILTQESNPILTEESNPILTEEPNPILTQESNPILNEEPNPILTEEPNVVPTEEPKADPIVDNFEDWVEFKNKISNPDVESVDTIMGSEETLKWLGLEGTGTVISDIIPDDIELILKQFQVSAQMVVFTFIIAFIWCLMKILLSIFNSSKKETELRNICCKSERKIYYFEAEKQKLQTEIDREREKARMAEERMQTAEHRVIPLEKDFIKIKNERDALQQKVFNLENELENAAEAGLEANRLLNDFLTSQKENINLNSSVDALQQQITKQAEIVAKYESTAKQKEKENRELKEKFGKMSEEMKRLKNLIKETENNLQIFQTNNEELKASKSELNSNLTKLEEEYSSLQKRSEEYFQRNEELLIDVQKMSEELNELKQQTANKDKEIESWKQIVKLKKSRKLHLNSDEEHNEEEDQIDNENSNQSLTELYDIVKMDIQLKNLTNDKNELNSKLEDVIEECRQLNDKIKFLEVNNQTLKNDKESAVRDRIKAENKLEVLTEHYRAKEMEFGKEIGVQQIQRQMKEEDADSLANQLVDLKDENTSLRSQLISMKKEIEDTERKYKSNINQLEKQVHENWILARNAERKVDEAKAEAAVLRQTLTMSVKSPIDGYGGDSSFMDDSASSISDHFGGALPPPPPPPMPPPPPGMFNPMMPPMHMQFNEENDATALWNQTMAQNMNSLSMGAIPPHFPQMPAFNHIQSDISINPNVSFHSSQSLSFVPQMQQMTQQWDSNRDTFSPSSHRSTSSPHLQYNMYSQSNSHYSNPMTSVTNPMTNSSMSTQFQNPMSSVTSPLVNSIPAPRPAVLSEPSSMHWTQPQRPNGNISNLNYSHNQYNNESEGSSRPISRNERNDNSLHTSIV